MRDATVRRAHDLVAEPLQVRRAPLPPRLQLPDAAAALLRGPGPPRMLAVVGLCGFGETAGAFTPGLGGRGQAAEDMAHELGRSVPGLHAGEIARVVVDECSLDFLKGSTIHFETTIMRTAFAVINNPNVELGCGCGVSFAPK